MECLGNVVEFDSTWCDSKHDPEAIDGSRHPPVCSCFVSVGLSHILQKAYPISSGLFPEAGRE